MNDIEELEGPFEQIAGAQPALAYESSGDQSPLSIYVSPTKTFCKGTVQVTATSTQVFEVITITFPDGSTKNGQSPLICTYTAKEDDCSKNIAFVARGDSSKSASTSVDVIKVEFKSLGTDMAETFYIADDEKPGHRRLGVIVDITAKVKLIPKQDIIPSNLKFRCNQWVNGHVGWIYALGKNEPFDPSGNQRIDEDRPPELGRIEPDSYDSETGILTMKFNDTPGRSVLIAKESSYSAVRADLKAADYIQMKTDSGNWQTLGKLEWHWVGGVELNPANGRYGDVSQATGTESTDTPRTPANP